MSDIEQLLERQARWQKSRKSLSWPEKIRMAEAIRESVLALGGTSPRRVSAPSQPPSEGSEAGSTADRIVPDPNSTAPTG